jgi:hypothetical protein
MSTQFQDNLEWAKWVAWDTRVDMVADQRHSLQQHQQQMAKHHL